MSYYDVSEFNKAFNANAFNGLNLLHLNISSITYNFDQLHALLVTLRIGFGIIGITETRIKSSKNPTNNIDLDVYAIENISNDASYAGALSYIKIHKLQNEERHKKM